MPDTQIENKNSSRSSLRSGPSPLFMVGLFLWVLCLLALIAGWYQWRAMVHAPMAKERASKSPDDDDPRPKKTKLVLQKDGSYLLQEVTEADEANPWDPEGIEDFSFTDSNVQKVTKQDLLGKPFVISFVFTNCRGPCPNVTLKMRELQDQLKGYDFNLVTLTVDPERDTIEVLKDYARENGANPDHWKFLTGPQREIYWLIHHSFKMPVEEAKDEKRLPGFEIIHSTNIMLVDATGRVIGKYNAQIEDDMSKLRKDVKRVAAMVSDRATATPRGGSDKKEDN